METTAIAPTIWTESFPPTAAIEPVLPDPHKPNDPVRFREVFADDSEVRTSVTQLIAFSDVSMLERQ